MATGQYVIYVQERLWRIARADSAGDVTLRELPGVDSEVPSLEERCKSALAVLLELGYRGQPILLSLPSDWCLCAAIATDGLPRKQRHQAMIYRLEDKLPIAAEQLTVDFITGRDQALGIATETQRIASLITALEDVGIAVQIIVPCMLLHIQHSRLPEPRSPIVLVADNDQISLLRFSGNILETWRLVPADAGLMRLHLQSILPASKNATEVLRHAITAVGLEPGLCESLVTELDVSVAESTSIAIVEDATKQAGAILAGRSAPLINLRRDQLAAHDPKRLIRGPLHALMMSAALLLIMTIVALHWRAQRYVDHAQHIDLAQREVYRQVEGAGQVPPNPRRRLESELRALQGRSGETGDMPVQSSALVHLHRLLVRLPSDLRFRILDIRVDGARVTLEGQARSHGDADAIANALRQQQGFSVEAPRTQQLREEKGVSFIVHAIAADQPEPARTTASVMPAK